MLQPLAEHVVQTLDMAGSGCCPCQTSCAARLVEPPGTPPRSLCSTWPAATVLAPVPTGNGTTWRGAPVQRHLHLGRASLRAHKPPQFVQFEHRHGVVRRRRERLAKGRRRLLLSSGLGSCVRCRKCRTTPSNWPARGRHAGSPLTLPAKAIAFGVQVGQTWHSTHSRGNAV